MRGHAATQPHREEVGRPLRDVRQARDAFVVVVVVGVRRGGQSLHLVTHARDDRRPLSVHERLIEPAEAHRPGEVADGGEPQLRGADEPLQLSAGAHREVRVRRRLGDPAVQQTQHQRHVRRDPLLRQEDAEHRRLQLGGAVQGVHAVMPQRGGQPVDEVPRQAGAFDIERRQVAVQVLPVRVDPQLRVGLLAGRAVAAELGEVREEGEELDLGGHHLDAGGPGLLARLEVARQRLGARIDVEAHEGRGQVGKQAAGACGGVRQRRADGDVDRGGVHHGRRGAVAQGLQAHERRHGLHLRAGHHQHLLDARGERRVDGGLHLHGLQHHDGGAGLDLVAHLHRRRHHQCGGRGAQHAPLVAGDAVGHAVDLDQVDGSVCGGDDAVALPADGHAAVHVVEALKLGLGGLAVHDDAVAPWRDGVGGDAVHGAAQLQVDGGAGLVLRLRPAAVRGGEQPVGLDRRGLLVGLDGRDHERHPGVLVGDQPAVGAGAVDPAGVGPLDRLVAAAGGGPAGGLLLGPAAGHLGLLEELEDEALVGGAALDDDGGLRHRAAEAAQRLVAGAAVGDDLGDHRVEVRGDRVALGHAGVDADAGAGGQVQPRDQAWGGGEVAVGVLCVEASLDGVAELDGALGQPAPASHMDLRLDEVELVGDLGDGVLHLQAGVDLQECEHLVARVVQELHGAGAAVVHREGQALCGRLQLVGLFGGQQRRGRLLDDLLVAALDRAVAHADGPRGALPVRDDLHLDVPRPGDERFEEHHAGAERALRLVAGALVGVRQLLAVGDLADAAAAAARRRLEHEGVADPVGGREGLVEGVDAAA